MLLLEIADIGGQRLVIAKMESICRIVIPRTFTISLILPMLIFASTLGVIECQGKQDYTKNSIHHDSNDKFPNQGKSAADAVGIKGDQLIYCEGDLSSCQNVLTNIICSNVKYCIVGNITPFVMSSPL